MNGLKYQAGRKRIPLPLFIKHFTSSEWHICDSISFLFSFSFWCMCVLYTCAHACMGALAQVCACRVQKGNSRFLISYFPPCSLKNLVPVSSWTWSLFFGCDPSIFCLIPLTIQHRRHVWPGFSYVGARDTNSGLHTATPSHSAISLDSLTSSLCGTWCGPEISPGIWLRGLSVRMKLFIHYSNVRQIVATRWTSAWSVNWNSVQVAFVC